MGRSISNVSLVQLLSRGQTFNKDCPVLSYRNASRQEEPVDRATAAPFLCQQVGLELPHHLIQHSKLTRTKLHKLVLFSKASAAPEEPGVKPASSNSSSREGPSAGGGRQ